MISLFKDVVVKFIESHSMAVLSTVDEYGQPHTTTIFYITHDKKTIRFITKSETAKHQNLNQNSKAAMTIIDEDKPISVNLTGTAEKLTNEKAHDETMQAIIQLAQEKLGDQAPIVKLHMGHFVTFEFRPTEAKLTDFTKSHSSTDPELHKF